MLPSLAIRQGRLEKLRSAALPQADLAGRRSAAQRPSVCAGQRQCFPRASPRERPQPERSRSVMWSRPSRRRATGERPSIVRAAASCQAPQEPWAICPRSRPAKCRVAVHRAPVRRAKCRRRIGTRNSCRLPSSARWLPGGLGLPRQMAEPPAAAGPESACAVVVALELECNCLWKCFAAAAAASLASAEVHHRTGQRTGR